MGLGGELPFPFKERDSPTRTFHHCESASYVELAKRNLDDARFIAGRKEIGVSQLCGDLHKTQHNNGARCAQWARGLRLAVRLAMGPAAYAGAVV